MSYRLAELQQHDGLWRTNLLDPDSYPMQEISGFRFILFALVWGMNNGFFEEKTKIGNVIFTCSQVKITYVIQKGWQGLVDCVTAEGKLEYVQPVGVCFCPTFWNVISIAFAIDITFQKVVRLGPSEPNIEFLPEKYHK